LLELGVGRGVSPIEVAFFGLDPNDGPEQFAEALAVILAGLQTRELNHQGRFYRFERVPMILSPVQRPHPPLWYGVNRAESVARVAAQGMNMMLNGPASRMREFTDLYRSEWRRLERAPVDMPLLGVSRHVVINENGVRARATAARAYRPWRVHIEKLWKERGVRFPLALPEEFGELQAMGLGIAGTPAEVRAFVESQVETAGISYLCARMCFGDMYHDEAVASAALYTSEVVAPLTSR
jgi:alkanesulfonate monooxygenase SsuD/methylene tetrahydromethanopterin reductase-like flavin-dependent oxidoreductase (luciferase family)